MSCPACQEITDRVEGDICYVRIGPANVAIVGCKEHLRALIDKLRASDTIIAGVEKLLERLPEAITLAPELRFALIKAKESGVAL